MSVPEMGEPPMTKQHFKFGIVGIQSERGWGTVAQAPVAVCAIRHAFTSVAERVGQPFHPLYARRTTGRLRACTSGRAGQRESPLSNNAAGVEAVMT